MSIYYINKENHNILVYLSDGSRLNLLYKVLYRYMIFNKFNNIVNKIVAFRYDSKH